MLRGLRLDGVDYGRCEMAAPWGLLFPAQEAARFHFIGRQGCWLLHAGEEWVELEPGDARAAAARRRACAGQRARRAGRADRALRRRSRSASNIFDVAGERRRRQQTLLFCGSMHFNVDRLHPLLRMMPEVMRAHELAANEPGIPHLLEAMAREVAMDRVGAGGILARLADVLAASIIRAWVERGCGDATGWIAAVRDPDIGRVLAAIHLDPEPRLDGRGAGAASWAPRAPASPSASPRSSARRRRAMSRRCACTRRGNG